jgi:CMP-N,N'-diacetyllegionaminic acid synthase
MIGSARVLALVPARGGSKRVPRKNLQLVGGKPLIEWTLHAARAARCIDHLAVSSEDDEILALAGRIGCDTALRRPAALATDDSPGVDPVLHALESLPGFDIVVLLQPTSPLRRPADIDGCAARCAAPGISVCVSVTPAREKPEWMVWLDSQGRMAPFSAAAGLAGTGPLYLLNGAVYAARVPWLLQHRDFMSAETTAYVMPQEFSLDVDTPLDLALADRLLQAQSAA